jgi:hypothetical protein
MDPYDRLLHRLEATLRDFEAGATPAVAVAAGTKGHIWRMPVQDVQHAILLKLVTLLSALNAARLLCNNGFVMEQGAIERVADEAAEDITFLVIGLSHGKTDRHDKFIADFWAEDFADHDDIANSLVRRNRVPRDKIRSTIHAITDDPSTANSVAKAIAAAYSGFVHGASTHAMEVYNPIAKEFRVRGVLGTPIHRSHVHDYWNYLYRGGVAFALAARVLGFDAHFTAILSHLDEFQRETERGGGLRS